MTPLPSLTSGLPGLSMAVCLLSYCHTSESDGKKPQNKSSYVSKFPKQNQVLIIDIVLSLQAKFHAPTDILSTTAQHHVMNGCSQL